MFRVMRSVQWLFIGAFLLTSWVGMNHDRILDFLNVKPNANSPEIERLAEATTMTRSAQRLFYRQDPTIEQRRNFMLTCSKVPVKGVMLGCYTRGKIAIQAVKEPKLDGIMEVTAAHEMLHAAYDKMSQSERDRLSPLLETAVSQVKDSRLLKVLNQYKASDRQRYLNELHSHLGTEVVDLASPELEKHYQQYFTDRRRLVSFALKSGAAMRQTDERMEALKVDIDRMEKELKSQKADLAQFKTTLTASSNDLESESNKVTRLREQAESASSSSEFNALAAEFEAAKNNFNAEVSRHNAQVQQQRDQVNSFNDVLETYNKKVDEYNQLGNEERAMFETLKSDDEAKSPATRSKSSK
jgi:chromosome segregation ATPase